MNTPRGDWESWPQGVDSRRAGQQWVVSNGKSAGTSLDRRFDNLASNFSQSLGSSDRSVENGKSFWTDYRIGHRNLDTRPFADSVDRLAESSSGEEIRRDKAERGRLGLSLGKQHVGYSRLDMPVLKLSVVGGRPFSSGGDKIFRPKLLSQRSFPNDIASSIFSIVPQCKFCSLLQSRSAISAHCYWKLSETCSLMACDYSQQRRDSYVFKQHLDKNFSKGQVGFYASNIHISIWQLYTYGVRNLEESKKKIINAALGAPDGHSLIFLAHNGPSGLGSKIDDICGKDWVFGGGDHGDSDLAQALLELRSKQLPIPLVVFGHMHKGLAYGGLRKMIVVGADGTIYLNGAIVPRVKNLHGRAGSSKTNNELHPEVRNEDGTVRAFSVVDIEKGRVKKISETWILVTSKRTALEQENILFQRP
ncbi:hypothetical protein MA16_Dca003368 [Dendrobium catenatum]|uniref:Calcineurin-like phosphoesterase domain-containing protein n=1 Tax=Dendrobium catenatum TaxID=906689 RepID=A0A2I0XCI3_9ASPA|nr:hypothetical protein MA16_Dca003368 [Dendrobium catenatum]